MKLTKIILSVVIWFGSFSLLNAQDQPKEDTLQKTLEGFQSDLKTLKKLKISGYMQVQAQFADSSAIASFAGGNFSANTNSRLNIRRGRVKFTYEHGSAMYVLNTDWTEKGVNIRETYVKITDPWTHYISLLMGMRQVQFGYDVSFSSSERETPERARMFQTLFPTERDMQALVTIQAPKTSRLNFLKLDMAVLNGSGVAAEFDSNKDYSGRISVSKSSKSEKVHLGVGVSYLTGGYRQNRKTEYDFGINTANDVAFIANSDTANYAKVAKREYMGADLQLTTDLPIGINTIRAEYIQGKQPGTSSSSISPNFSPTSDLYHRQFNGASFYFIQNIGQSKHQFISKYDWYDPSINISGKQIGKSGTNTKVADIKYTTIGLGWVYRFDSNTKITLYYDLVTNEETSLSGYTRDVKDNVWTFRLQYKF
jgi:phosphate-selective porin